MPTEQPEDAEKNRTRGVTYDEAEVCRGSFDAELDYTSFHVPPEKTDGGQITIRDGPKGPAVDLMLCIETGEEIFASATIGVEPAATLGEALLEARTTELQRADQEIQSGGE